MLRVTRLPQGRGRIQKQAVWPQSPRLHHTTEPDRSPFKAQRCSIVSGVWRWTSEAQLPSLPSKAMEPASCLWQLNDIKAELTAEHLKALINTSFPSVSMGHTIFPLKHTLNRAGVPLPVAQVEREGGGGERETST